MPQRQSSSVFAEEDFFCLMFGRQLCEDFRSSPGLTPGCFLAFTYQPKTLVRDIAPQLDLLLVLFEVAHFQARRAATMVEVQVLQACNAVFLQCGSSRHRQRMCLASSPDQKCATSILTLRHEITGACFGTFL